MLTIEPMELHDPIDWALPPSKSHMIRWLALAAQAEGETVLSFDGEPGEDVHSMAGCLKQLGVSIEMGDSSWIVNGVGPNGFSVPKGVLDCGNSATTARFLMAIAAGMKVPAHLDGDRSLRRRDMSALAETLRLLGCEVTSDTLPLAVTGPVVPGLAHLDLSASSQPLSALLMASPGYSGPIHFQPSPQQQSMFGMQSRVSVKYSDLSYSMAASCGSSNKPMNLFFDIEPWRPVTPDEVEIPVEDSLLPIAMLLSELHDVEVVISRADLEPRGATRRLTLWSKSWQQHNYIRENLPSLTSDGLGFGYGGPWGPSDNPKSGLTISQDIDIISPAAALMALDEGGWISGATHARGKESDRISSTVYLLSCFGMEAAEAGLNNNEIEVVGGQIPTRPEAPVETHGDHRLAMTAMVLASKVGGTIVNPEISAVTDPEFIERLTGLGK